MQSPRILLVGEPSFALAESPSLLALHSPEFLLTTSGAEALALFPRLLPRLAVVSDVLGDISARELLARLRSTPRTRSSSLLLLTDDQALAPGANAVLSLATPHDELVERADRLLSIAPRVSTSASVCLGRPLRPLGEPSGRPASFARAVNLSETGLLLACQERLSTGEDVSLHFVLPRHLDLITARGRVVREAPPAMASWPESPWSFGIEFNTLVPRHQLKIRSYIRESQAA